MVARALQALGVVNEKRDVIKCLFYNAMKHPCEMPTPNILVFNMQK